MLRVLEEIEAHQALLVVEVLLLSVGQDHVVDALKRGARYAGILADDRQIFLERALPRQFREYVWVLQRSDSLNEGRGQRRAHPVCLPAGCRRQAHSGTKVFYHVRPPDAAPDTE